MLPQTDLICDEIPCPYEFPGVAPFVFLEDAGCYKTPSKVTQYCEEILDLVSMMECLGCGFWDLHGMLTIQ